MAWITMSFQSDTLHMPVMLDVLIPQGHGNYKSLYLLHGAGGDHSSWITKTRIADYADNKDLVVFMPSGNNKCYVDNVNGKDYFKFIAEELVSKCETWFPISKSKEDRYIAGMSMGAYGAVNAALEKPDSYAAVFSYSGLMDIIERYDNPRGLDFTPVFGTREQLLTGNFDLMKKVHICRDKFGVNVDKPTKFYLYCGLADRILPMSERMYYNMCDNGYMVQFETDEGGHNWEYWDRCLRETVDMIMGGESKCR